jgi:hypothetical protein
MVSENPWMYWQEVARIFNCCRTKAYAIIKKLNDELEAKGYLTYPGRVSRKYFNERFYGYT